MTITTKSAGMKAFRARQRQAYLNKKMKAVEAHLVTLRRESRLRAPSSANETEFINYAWEKFDPGKILYILHKEGDGFSYQKKILFQALCAWTIAPGASSIFRSAVALSTGSSLVEAEERIRKRAPEDRAVTEALTRFGVGAHAVHPDFFDEIYHPIGGLKTILEAPDRNAFVEDLRRRSKNVEEIIRLVDVLHYHVDVLLPLGKHREPSISTGAGLLHQISYYPDGVEITNKREGNNIRFKERSIQELWAKFYPSITLLTAASKIEYNGSNSLLSAIIDGKAQYKYAKESQLINQWFGKARYVSERILEKCAFASRKGYSPLQFGDISVVHFPPPTLSTADHIKIEKAYRKIGAAGQDLVAG